MEAARKQTKGMIHNKIKRGQLSTTHALNEILRKELNEGKIKVLEMDEFKRMSMNEPTAFTRLNLAFNPDSLSTSERLIHNFTVGVRCTTLSMEV